MMAKQQWYMIFMNGEPLIPANTDSITDYITAETVLDFLELVNPSEHLTIEEVELHDVDLSSLGGDYE